VVVYDDTIMGDRVTIHAGTVIANDGLGYAPVGEKWIKIPQIGIVRIGDDVEIGSSCSIDRATIGSTMIGSGTKMSNLVAIGHGARIGENCMLVAQVGLAGSVDVGNHVTMAGQAGVVGHIRVGDNAVIGAKAGVTNNVPDGETVLGQPAIPIAEMKRRVALLGRLPELRDTMRTLKKRMARLERLEEEVEALRSRLEESTRVGPD
jgi:UDP-3-O-[3-hydroxymyristoyl] glucosamine N-acyltransferase